MTLDPDVEQILRARMRETGQSFKEAVNEAIRRSTVGTGRAAPFATAPAAMGRSRANLDRALQLVGALEDDDLLRRIRAGS